MRARVCRTGLALGGLLMAGSLLLLLRPDCLILKYTGFFCAGCGTQHMALALLHGDLAGAAGENLFMLLLLPLTGAYLVWECVRYIRGKRPLWRTKAFLAAAAAVLAVSLAFTVARNLPGSWLAPRWASL